MIPLRDDVPSRSVPLVTIALIVLNVLVYLYEVSLGVGGDGAAKAFIFEFGAMPCRLTGACAGLDDFPSPLVTVFTSMFMHSLNPMHVIGNMLYLWIFGDNSILTLVGFAFFWRFVHVPAMVMIGFWVLMQLLLGYLTVSASTGGAEIGGVAWFAHIGGFLTGVVLLFLLRPRRSARS